jgi:hypothetical protein
MVELTFNPGIDVAPTIEDYRAHPQPRRAIALPPPPCWHVLRNAEIARHVGERM